MSGVVIWFGWLVAMGAHPFHVSVTQMDYKEDTKEIQIASKVFLDDIEAAYNDFYDIEVDLWDLREDAETDEKIRAFFEDQLKIWINGREETLVYVGKEIDIDAGWFYFKIERVRKVKEMRIRYTVALRQFDDQVNLLHMKYKGQEESLRIDRTKMEDTITFEN